MGRFVVRRVGQGLVVVFGVTIIVFVVTRMIGDPVTLMLPLEATPADRAAFERRLGFDRSIPVQLVDYLGDVASFRFGDSLWEGRPAAEIVLEALPRTLELVLTGMALAVLVAVPLGVIAATKPGSALDRLAVFLSLIGLSIPQFWLGLLLILVFAVQLKVLPTAGIGGLNRLILPAITLALPAIGRLAMVVRSSMIDALNEQYVKMAWAKGMSGFRVVGVHALRNASVPTLTLTGWELIRALAGYSVVVETVFAWPGLGFIAHEAIEREDLILLQAIVFLVAVLVVGVNIAVDVLNKVIDPRIQLS